MTGMSLLLLWPTATANTYTVAGATQTQVLASTSGIETFTADPPIATLPPPPRPGHPLLNVSASLAPLTMDDCKSGGWQEFGVFKNQGDCVSYVATGGRNQPAG